MMPFSEGTVQDAISSRVLVVEDDNDMAALLKSFLEHEHIRVDLANDLTSAIEQLKYFSHDAVLLDMNLGDESGLDLIPHIQHKSPFSKIIVMTSFGSVDVAVDAMEKGATTFITKSDNPEKITNAVITRLKQSRQKALDPDSHIQTRLGIIGQSKITRELIDKIMQLKDVDATVLIQGESGTGKEVVARAIHLTSERHRYSFEALNCGAIPDNLLESELFGHKKGAFTDAKYDHKGVFEVCSEGTLFLDEIGDLPLNLQVKLLRVLQEREIKPIGSEKTIKIHTRVICATNKNLELLIKEGKFREDLYYRINVLPIHLPSLKQRKEDIPLLTKYFVEKFNSRYKKNVAEPDTDTYQQLLEYSWPGNIRELQNIIERGVILSADGKLNIQANILNNGQETSKEDSLKFDSVIYREAKEQFEKDFLKKILRATKGNVSEAARLSGRVRSDLYRLIDKYQINRKDFF